jgi:hypothetical protein
LRIFVSWSGEKSRDVANALRDWLPYVLPSAEPWMSATDIDRGARWSTEISTQLAEANVGIICLTPENLEAPWILFEAGALSKALSRSLVCTYLVQLKAAEMKGPLAQFQATLASAEDTKRLILSMNRACGPQALPDERVAKMFDVWWPELEKKLAAAGSAKAKLSSPHRSDRELLEEILGLMRKNERQDALRDLAQNSDRTAPKTPTLTIDTRALVGDNGGRIKAQYPLFGTVSEFLDDLYSAVRSAVPPHTYGRKWILRDPKTGKSFAEMGRTWAKANLGTQNDERSLAEVGIEPDMSLDAIPMPKEDH